MFDKSHGFMAMAIFSLPFWLSANAVHAATMNFDALPDEGAQLSTYVENGIQASALGGVLAYESNLGFAHFDDSGTGLAYGADFRMAGVFDAVDFSLVSFGYDFLDAPGPLSDNIFVSGYLGGSLVSTVSYILSDIVGATQSFALGSSFAGIDRLRIELRYPVNTAACGAPCGHFDLDSVTLNGAPLAPVPLPPAIAMMGLSGLALWGVGRKSKADASA